MEDADDTSIQEGVLAICRGKHHYIGVVVGVDRILVAAHVVRCKVDPHDLVSE